MSKDSDRRPIGTEGEPSMVAVTVRLGELPPRTEQFGILRWSDAKYPNRNVLTTQPRLLQSILHQGPLAFEGYPTTTVTAIEVPEGKDIMPEIPGFAFQLNLDERTGLVTFEKETDVEVVSVDGRFDQPPHMTIPKKLYNSMEDWESAAAPDFGHSYLYKQLPQLQQSFAALGFTKTESEAKSSHTLPRPSELKRRMDILRESDTSGISYPEIALIEQGDIDSATYLRAYAEGKHPVATISFGDYIHDAAGEHMIAFMLHPRLMDVVSKYAQTVLDRGDTDAFNDAAGMIDGLTTNMGMCDLEMFATPDSQRRATFGLQQLISTLQEAGRVDELEIVQWAKEKGRMGETVNSNTLVREMISDAGERLLIWEREDEQAVLGIDTLEGFAELGEGGAEHAATIALVDGTGTQSVFDRDAADGATSVTFNGTNGEQYDLFRRDSGTGDRDDRDNDGRE
jgi:hypothetical protein